MSFMGQKRLSVRGLRAGLLAAMLLTAALPSPTGAKRLPVYRSPDYKGVHKAPKTLPAKPLTPITLGSNGRNLQVLVDAAGTAQIVWTEDGGAGPGLTRYCRLRRGSKSCDNPPASQRLVPPQPGDPQFNDESYPRVLAVGNDIAIISYRYPTSRASPTGAQA